MGTFSLSKSERLRSKIVINDLFKSGQSLFSHPIKLVYLDTPVDEGNALPPISVSFSVPKRQFKRAVDRNLLKRRMREAYRLNKQELVAELPSDPSTSYALMYIYVHKEKLDYQDINRSMKKLNRLFIKALHE